MSLADGVVFQALPAETFVLDLRTGGHHSLKPSAGRMLELLVATGDVRAAAVRLAGEVETSPREVEIELDALCDHLVALGLARVVADAA